MPMWTINHTPDVFSTDDKDRLARSITELYESFGLPAYYVMVLFRPIDRADIYVGGEDPSQVVRISVDHIARRLPDARTRRRSRDAIGAMLAPHLEKPGLHWEIHIDETAPESWLINGEVPPEGRGEDEFASLN